MSTKQEFADKLFKRVDYELEIESLLNNKSKFITVNDLFKINNNLEWFMKNNIKLYYPNDKTKPYVYLFFYKGEFNKISALTLKILFIGKSSGSWYTYNLGEKLLNILLNKEEKEKEEILKSSEVIKINLSKKFEINETATDLQKKYTNDLLKKNGYEVIFNNLDKNTASVIIDAIKLNKKLVFFKDEMTEEEIDNMLDKMIINYTPPIKD